MQYYNAKNKFIMKILGSLGCASRRVRRSRRGGAVDRTLASRTLPIIWTAGTPAVDLLDNFGGGKRPFRKRTCRSKSRCVGGGDIMRNWKRFGTA